MTRDELDALLREVPPGSPEAGSRSALPAPTLVPALVSLGVAARALRVVPEAPGAPEAAARWNDRCVPPAYRGDPRALHARARPQLRRAVLAMPAAQRYGAMFLGPSRAGKSSAAAWAIRRWWSAQGAAAAKATLAWLDAIVMTDGDRRYRLGTGDPEELSLAYRADWLVLDDVNLSCSAALVQLVLARRYQACLPTILTTGLREPELVAHIGAAACRRVVEFRGVSGLVVDCHEKVPAC